MGAGRQNVMGGLSELSQVGQMYMYGNSGDEDTPKPNPTYNANFNPSRYLRGKGMPTLGSKFNS